MLRNRWLGGLVTVPVLFAVLIPAACERTVARFECTDRIGCLDLAPGAPLKIGVLQALSGKVAALGQEQVRGIQLAVDHRPDGVLGHRIELRIEDTGCTAEGGANTALKIIADPETVAILGTTCSGAAATASKAMSDAGLTMISGNNSAPFLTSMGGRRAPDWQPGYFRTAPNEESSGKAAAIFAFSQLGVRRAATINDGDIYTRGLTEGFGRAFSELGGEIVLATSVNKGDREMNPVVTAALNAGTQLLFFPLFQPEGNLVLLEARKTAGFEKVVLMSDGALIESTFIEAVKSAATGMYFVGPAPPTGAAVDLLAREYESRFQASPAAIYYQSAYDAAGLLFRAIEQAAFKDAAGLVHIGRQALREALYATLDYPGVTGNLSCDEFGDCAAPVFNVLRLDDPAAGLEGLQANVMFTYSVDRSR